MGREKERWESIERAKRCGLTEADAIAVRRIALTLHRWFELECGDSNNYGSWCIEREEATGIFARDNSGIGKPFMVIHTHHDDGKTRTNRYVIADRETGARKRLDKIMARYPDWRAWIQTDPRGGTIYLCRPADATDSLYTRGVFIA